MIVIDGQPYALVYDAVNPQELPPRGDGYIGYANGRFDNVALIRQLHAGVPVWGLSVTAAAVGQGVDSEPGNASPEGAAQCNATQLLLGVKLPIVYCEQSWIGATVAAHDARGIARNRYFLLSSHKDGPTMPGAPPGVHICGPICGAAAPADGTQCGFLGTYDMSIIPQPWFDMLAAALSSTVALPIPPAVQGRFTMYVGIAHNSNYAGYWCADSSGLVDAFGGAPDFGGMAGKQLDAPIVGIAAHPQASGYWLVGADGGVFTFGAAEFHGSMGGQYLASPIVGIAPTRTGLGYRLLARGGGIFDFGDAAYDGRPAHEGA